MAAEGKAEVRFEVNVSDLAILDGYVIATNANRADVFREMLAAWSAKKRHEAVLICRVAGVNPSDPEPDRKAQGGTTT